MSLMDEFQEERDKIKNAPLKAKWKYFVDYYLVKTLIILGVVALVIGVIVTILTKKDTVLYVSLVDFVDGGIAESEIKKPFTERYVADPRKEEIVLDCTLQSDYTRSDDAESGVYGVSYEDEMRQTMLMAGDVDLMISGEDALQRYGENGFLKPLKEVYSASDLEGFEQAGRLKYVDGEAMALRLEGVPLLTENYRYVGAGKDQAEIFVSFPHGEHTDMALLFLDFLEGKQ